MTYGLPEKEIKEAIRLTIPIPPGVARPAKQAEYVCRTDTNASELSAEEFQTLEQIRAALEGTQVTLSAPKERTYYRPADEQDDPDEIDSDGDVRIGSQCVVIATRVLVGHAASLAFLLGERDAN